MNTEKDLEALDDSDLDNIQGGGKFVQRPQKNLITLPDAQEVRAEITVNKDDR
ncbi:MAG: hypothetical protein AAGD13_05960 [Pseudomonadota bacterium]